MRFDENAIKQAVKNLVYTDYYERLFHPEIGSNVFSLLFEPFGPRTQMMLVQAITDTILNHEPRVDLKHVDVEDKPDYNAIAITIVFVIKNTTTPISLNFLMDRTR